MVMVFPSLQTLAMSFNMQQAEQWSGERRHIVSIDDDVKDVQCKLKRGENLASLPPGGLRGLIATVEQLMRMEGAHVWALKV